MKYLVTVEPGPMPQQPIEVLRGAQGWLQAKLDDGSLEFVHVVEKASAQLAGQGSS